MSYIQEINELIRQVPVEIVDFSKPRDYARIPTQASSNFITNKEQGDWAERLIINAINDNFQGIVAVKYGKSDGLVAGDDGFDEFYAEFQEELDTIGKRPDILIFRREDYSHGFGLDISHMRHDQIDGYVRKALAGIEVRSSAFLVDRYDEAMLRRTGLFTGKALAVRDEIMAGFRAELEHPMRSRYLELLRGITPQTVSVIDFRVPSWRSTPRLRELSEKFGELKSALREIQKRDYLSITPKVEDLKVVYKWIETFNVPHFYFQVFFDKVYGISFSRILSIISDPDNDGVVYSVESDTKNQNKTTIKINSKVGVELAERVDEPGHSSRRKEMGRGRLLFYVTFEGGCAHVDASRLASLLDIDENDLCR